jgi:hypothetical protein
MFFPRFTDTGPVSDASLDKARVRDLLELWREAKAEETEDRHTRCKENSRPSAISQAPLFMLIHICHIINDDDASDNIIMNFMRYKY